MKLQPIKCPLVFAMAFLSIYQGGCSEGRDPGIDSDSFDSFDTDSDTDSDTDYKPALWVAGGWKGC